MDIPPWVVVCFSCSYSGKKSFRTPEEAAKDAQRHSKASHHRRVEIVPSNVKNLPAIRLYSGELICAKDKYLIERHFYENGKICYRGDLGDVRDCGDMRLPSQQTNTN